MKKRTLSLILALLMVCSLLPVSAAADAPKSGTCGENVTWTLDDAGVLTISGTGEATEKPWLEYKDSIKSVVVKEGVTSLFGGSFAGCTELTKVDLPGSLKSMGYFSFGECTGLSNIDIPVGVKEIDANVFSGCTGLTSVNIPYGVEIIKSGAFANCTGLKNITIPNSVKEIWGEVFSGCTGLTSITVPESVTSLSSAAFSGCTSLTSANIKGGIKTLNASMFADCSSLKSVSIPSSVTNIVNYAFDGCTALKDVYFGGTQAQWEAIKIGSANEALKSAVIHYGSTYPFTDVDPAGRHAPFAEAIQWAVNEGITTGYGNGIFKPNADCSRAQVVTFLWRAAGSPAPKSEDNPFVDVFAKQDNGNDNPFYTAILWAVENGITNGVDATHFAPSKTCTRAQVVTFLWRAEGQPEPASAVNPFADVSAKQDNGNDNPFYTAILWAVGEGITNGTDKTHFSPNNTCTRAQVVTFIYRDIA